MTGSQILIYHIGTKNRAFLVDLRSILLGVQKGQLNILGAPKDLKELTTGSQTLIYSIGTKNIAFLDDLKLIFVGVQKGKLNILGASKDQKRTFKDDWISDSRLT